MTANTPGRNPRIQTLLIPGWCLLLAWALWLRLGALEDRPMHADEAVQGMIFSELLESGHYTYNPRHYHGPSLYYLTLPVAWASGENNSADLHEQTLRMVPFLFGLLLAATPMALLKELNFPGMTVASGFLLLSPGLVYFSGYYIQEMILLAGLGWFTVCLWRWLRDGKAGWAVGAGLAAGLMLSSKENAPLLILLAGGSILAHSGVLGRVDSGRSVKPIHLAWVAMALLAVALPLFISFGRNPGGLLDAIRGWFVYEPVSGHQKPWNYYLSILTGWTRSPFKLQGEAGLTLAALLAAGVILFHDRHAAATRFGRSMLLLTALLFLLLSAVPYKTPWLVLVVLFGLAMVAGTGFTLVWERHATPPRRAAILVLLGLCWFSLAREAVWTTRIRPADDRNPYAYVHTSWDLPLLAERLHRIAGETQLIKIMADEYWPLPWYLRDLEQAGYWHDLPENPYAPVMVVGGELAGQLDASRLQDYQVEFRGLRPGKLLFVYVHQDLWEAYTGQSD